VCASGKKRESAIEQEGVCLCMRMCMFSTCVSVRVCLYW